MERLGHVRILLHTYSGRHDLRYYPAYAPNNIRTFAGG